MYVGSEPVSLLQYVEVCLRTGFISLHSIPILITLSLTPPCIVVQGEKEKGEGDERGD